MGICFKLLVLCVLMLLAICFYYVYSPPYICFDVVCLFVCLLSYVSCITCFWVVFWFLFCLVPPFCVF